jgi:uncharacterized membrane protein YciS (DUF1049 family)
MLGVLVPQRIFNKCFVRIVYVVGFTYVVCQSFFNLSVLIDITEKFGTQVDYILSIIGFYHYQFIDFSNNRAYKYITGEFSVPELEFPRMYGTFTELSSFL